MQNSIGSILKLIFASIESKFGIGNNCKMTVFDCIYSENDPQMHHFATAPVANIGTD